MASSNFIPDISLMQRRKAHMHQDYLNKLQNKKIKIKWPQSSQIHNTTSALASPSNEPLRLPLIDEQHGGALRTEVSSTRFNIIQKQARTQANSRLRQSQQFSTPFKAMNTLI